jgi:hypothetical protein
MTSNDSVHTSSWRTPVLVLVAGCLIAMIGYGIRSVFGLFLEPMTQVHGWGRETFAMAVQNRCGGLDYQLLVHCRIAMAPRQ